MVPGAATTRSEYVSISGPGERARTKTQALFPRPRVARDHDRADASAWTKRAFDFSPFRLAGAHYVLENAVHDVFLEDAQIAVTDQVFLQRFQFEAALVGHVANPQRPEIGQASFGTYGGELGYINLYLVAGNLVRPGFDFGRFSGETSVSMFPSVTCALCHGPIVAIRAASWGHRAHVTLGNML